MLGKNRSSLIVGFFLGLVTAVLVIGVALAVLVPWFAGLSDIGPSTWQPGWQVTVLNARGSDATVSHGAIIPLRFEGGTRYLPATGNTDIEPYLTRLAPGESVVISPNTDKVLWSTDDSLTLMFAATGTYDDGVVLLEYHPTAPISIWDGVWHITLHDRPDGTIRVVMENIAPEPAP